jgi:hypothetical protein
MYEYEYSSSYLYRCRHGTDGTGQDGTTNGRTTFFRHETLVGFLKQGLKSVDTSSLLPMPSVVENW